MDRQREFKDVHLALYIVYFALPVHKGKHIFPASLAGFYIFSKLRQPLSFRFWELRTEHLKKTEM